MRGTLVDLAVARRTRTTEPAQEARAAGPSARALLLYRWGELVEDLSDHELASMIAIVEEDVAAITGALANAGGL